MTTLTRQQVLDKHDRWLLRLTKKQVMTLAELEQFWLFRDLMFKHWNKFPDSNKRILS